MKKIRPFFLLLLTSVVLMLCSLSVRGEDWGVVSALKPFVDKGEVPGAVVLIGTPDTILTFETEGFADIEAKKPLTKDSLFWIASMSKPITAAGLMILYDEGKIKLDDPISKYFPEFNKLKVIEKEKDGIQTLRPPKSVPTVRQILSHTGGFEFITPFMKRFGIDSLPVKEVAFTAATFPMPRDPATKYSYSNVGIDIAGAIIEQVSGMPLEKFLQVRLFDPLEMKETTFFPTAKQLERLAKSYTWDKESKKLKVAEISFLHRPYSDQTKRYPEGGGGLFSTTEDSFHFHQMLAAGGVYKGKRILSENAIAEMTKDQTGGLGSYGFGLNIHKEGFGHGGAHATNGQVFTEHKLIMIYMTQITGVPGHPKSRDALNAAIMKKLATLKK